MLSADCHCNEPNTFWWTRLDEKFKRRVPHVEVDEKGEKWLVVEGYQKSRVRARNFEDAPKGGEDRLRSEAGDPQDRTKDHRRDGIEAEIIFPNKGLAMWATQDVEFRAAQCVGDIRTSQGEGNPGAGPTYDASAIVFDVGSFHDRDAVVAQVSAVGLGAGLLLFSVLCTAGSSPRHR
jgi:hypothetical protein